MTGDPPAVIVESPEKIEENIYEQEEKNDLLQSCGEIGPGELFPENDPEELKGLEQYDEDEEAVEEVAGTERDPSEQQTLEPGNEGIKSVSIVLFHPVRVPGNPFYRNGQYDKQDPVPALHQPAEQPCKKLLHGRNF